MAATRSMPVTAWGTHCGGKFIVAHEAAAVSVWHQHQGPVWCYIHHEAAVIDKHV